jgi:hypothetical protein
MSLSDLASLGSFVSGVAVLVSLVFLFFQMRQMTEQARQAERNQRALLNQGHSDRFGNHIRWEAEPYMADLVSRVMAGETKFTSAELRQLELQFRGGMVTVQDAYVQHRAGLVDQITYENDMAQLRRLLRSQVYRAIWKVTHRTYPPEWVAFIDRVIEETPLAKPADFVARFDSAMAEIAPVQK